MFRKVPHLDDLVFWIGEMHMTMHDDLLTHSWGINRGQLLLRRMDSGGDMAQIQCDRFLKGNVWGVLRPHSITDSALSDLYMEAFLESEADYTNPLPCTSFVRKVDKVSEGRTTTQRLFNRNGNRRTRTKRGRLESSPWVPQGFGTVFLCSRQAEFCTNGATIYI